MPAIYPFRAVQYNNGSGDVSARVAPPYDVLSAEQKAAFLAKDPTNVVSIDLPHVPPKELGPARAYADAAETLERMLADGTLARREKPAIFVYRQTFTIEGKQFQRTGVACTVDAVPFGPRAGGGVLPHEQTFSGPKEDRKALMEATATQLSPIFGLHPDDDGVATKIARGVCDSHSPDMTADLGDGVMHEVWTVDDDSTVRAYQDALAGEDVFIADGHHRYNTALNYLDSRGDVPADHPARRTMFVLVSMSDPGLYIGPTHRVLGGMAGYSIEAFQEAAQGIFNIEPCDNNPEKFDHEIEHVAARGHDNVLGIMDFATGLCFCGYPATPDPLEDRFGDKPKAWRTLDVAVVQHLIV
ncbi:MAG: DUF1015 domain-containing protein, partial [Phycisphaerales bacterium]|nr:DUF1015 domain-containing protein [Phycisphaerales bacterium]